MEDEPDIFRSATKLIHAKSDPLEASGRAPQPQPQVDLLKAKIDLEAAKRVIFELGVAAMTAQSDPHAKAAVYRKALIDICNAALKAQSSAGEGRAPAPQPANGPLILSARSIAHFERTKKGNAEIADVIDALCDRLMLAASAPAEPPEHTPEEWARLRAELEQVWTDHP